MSTITIENVGAIKHVTIPIPESGGVVVLQGRNGSGKSTALQAVEAAVTGKGGLPLRDGTEKGLVEGCGVTLKVGKSTRSSGKLEVETLEGRLSLAELVDPGIKDARAADVKRVRALIALSGSPATAEEFGSLLPDPTAVIMANGEDALQYADSLKKQCEGIARDLESKAEGLSNKAAAFRLNAGEVNLDVQVDRNKLAGDVQAAIVERQRLASLKEEADRDNERRAKLRRSFNEAAVGFNGTEGPEGELQAAKKEVADKQEEVDRLTAELARSQKELSEARSVAIQKQSNYDAAVRTRNMLEEMRTAIQADSLSPPSEGVMTAANEAVAAAQQAEREALDTIQKQQALKAANSTQDEAKAKAKEAAAWRKAAGEVAGVLSAKIATLGTPLFVDGERLVLKTDRGQTFFADLSAGERWKLVIDIAVGLLGTHSLLTIPQEAWEGLQPKNRTLISDYAKERGVTIVTAQASDDEQITAESL